MSTTSKSPRKVLVAAGGTDDFAERAIHLERTISQNRRCCLQQEVFTISKHSAERNPYRPIPLIAGCHAPRLPWVCESPRLLGQRAMTNQTNYWQSIDTACRPRRSSMMIRRFPRCTGTIPRQHAHDKRGHGTRQASGGTLFNKLFRAMTIRRDRGIGYTCRPPGRWLPACFRRPTGASCRRDRRRCPGGSPR